MWLWKKCYCDDESSYSFWFLSYNVFYLTFSLSQQQLLNTQRTRKKTSRNSDFNWIKFHFYLFLQYYLLNTFTYVVSQAPLNRWKRTQFKKTHCLFGVALKSSYFFVFPLYKCICSKTKTWVKSTIPKDIIVEKNYLKAKHQNLIELSVFKV